MRAVMIALVAVLMLSACGQKGPLYLPKQDTAHSSNFMTSE